MLSSMSECKAWNPLTIDHELLPLAMMALRSPPLPFSSVFLDNTRHSVAFLQVGLNIVYGVTLIRIARRGKLD